MESLLLILGIISPIILILGVAIKFYKISKMPLNVRWEIYPLPHEKGERGKYGGSYMEELNWLEKKPERYTLGGFKELFKEILYLHRVKKFNPYGIWIWSMALHWGIWLLFLWMAILIVNSVSGLEIASQLSISAYLSYILGVIGVVGLIIKRVTVHDLRIYTYPIDYVNLLFLLLLFASGLLSVMNKGGVNESITYLEGLLKGKITFAELSSMTILHFLIFKLFLIYIPFSKFFHGPVKYMTFHKILWDDMYQVKGSEEDKKISEQLNYRVRWSGPHILSDKSWLENAQNTNLNDKV